jgi:hypothetical protein
MTFERTGRVPVAAWLGLLGSSMPLGFYFVFTSRLHSGLVTSFPFILISLLVSLLVLLGSLSGKLVYVRVGDGVIESRWFSRHQSVALSTVRRLVWLRVAYPTMQNYPTLTALLLGDGTAVVMRLDFWDKWTPHDIARLRAAIGVPSDDARARKWPAAEVRRTWPGSLGAAEQYRPLLFTVGVFLLLGLCMGPVLWVIFSSP